MQFTSDIVYITLPKYGLTWRFRKCSILDMFPESLLGLALTQDPTAEEIVLEHPDVTSTAIDILYVILEKDGDFTPLDVFKEMLNDP